MAISYPRTFPDANHVASVSIQALNAAVISQSDFTFSQQVVAHPGQRWEAEITLRAMKRTEAEIWLAWLTSLKGPIGTFLMGDPRACSPLGSAGGTPIVDGAGQTGAELNITGATINQTGWAKAGDYIQLGTGTAARLHKILQDAASDGSGDVTLDIWPDLRASPADTDPIVISNAVGHWRLASRPGWTAGELSTYGITFAAIEALV